MLAVIYARLLRGFGHAGGLRHGGTAGIHLLGVLLMIAVTVVAAAAATAAVSSWVAKRYENEDSTKAAAWVTFVVVFAALGWLTLRIA
jgi:flagellar basal body-associated protein FliL